MSHYPADREADVVLRDGSTIHVRPVRPEDEPAVLAFYRELSEETRYLRFFSGTLDFAEAARRAVEVDYQRRFALVAEAGPERRVAADAMYLTTAPERAEVALAISDAYQGRGLGTILLGQLAEAAHHHGIRQFEAPVLPQNYRMIQVFRESGFPVDLRYELGEISVEFPTSLSPEALERFERRGQTAAIAAMEAFLAPRSVAVIGASRSRGTIGGEVFHNLLATGFNGPVYPVNPGAEVVQSVVAYADVRDIPGPVDLAVIVVPAALVVDVARQCGEKGVRALVVISSGFAETGEEGRGRQRELLAECREFGMRLIGPNCMGLMNVSSEVRLNATFAPMFPPHGRVGFSSQSGALGLAVIDHASSLGLGLSSFVSVGNKADISGNDLIHYWEADPDTDVILLYLESFGNPRKFARITRQVGKTKPIIAVKSGRSAAGARATSSHTGALIAASDVTVDALFRQAGVIRTDTLAEMFDVASLLANQPPPAGPRVGILTNAGGLGILCADACEASGLEVPTLPEAPGKRLFEFLPPEASVGVPEFADFRSADAAALLEAAVADGPRWLRPDEVSALLSCYGLPLADWRLAESPEAAARAAEELGGPVALKAVAPGLVHKTEAGAVRLGLAAAALVEEVARDMTVKSGAPGRRVSGPADGARRRGDAHRRRARSAVRPGRGLRGGGDRSGAGATCRSGSPRSRTLTCGR